MAAGHTRYWSKGCDGAVTSLKISSSEDFATSRREGRLLAISWE
jgi:hypothetical protein